jgi:hypothetical protein
VARYIAEAIGKKEIVKALKTSNHKKAIDRLRVESVEVDALFAEARRKITLNPGSKSTGTEQVPLTDVEIHQLVRRWFEEREKDAISRLDAEPLGYNQRQDAAEASLDGVSALSCDGGVAESRLEYGRKDEIHGRHGHRTSRRYCI